MFLQAKKVKSERRARLRAKFSFKRRSSGLLLHPTSLPGPHGSGDLGAEARKFIDFCAAAGQTWWQMLPVGPVGAPPGNSPYSSSSSFAGNPYLIDLNELAREGLLAARDLKAPRGLSNAAVNFPVMRRFRDAALRKAFAEFKSHERFEAFCIAQKSWLDDFALFSALKRKFNGASWVNWDRDVRTRKPAALARVRDERWREIEFHKWVQFEFDRQWRDLRVYATSRGVGLIGDIPIFVSHDSADVWARPEMFVLDRAGRPKIVSGYPPDDFNKDGQHWGHAHYDWPKHEAEDFVWWVKRFGAIFRLFDGVRIDHFLGFTRVWAIPASAPTAATGKWISVPGAALFEALKRALGNVPIIAEDLGLLTKSAERLRNRCGFPGMRIMQFGFGDGGSYHLPHKYPRRSVVYPGTHDNDTIVGWLDQLKRDARRKKNSPRARELENTYEYLHLNGDGNAHWSFIRAAFASPADTAVFQVQDILGLDGSARMNVPGTAQNNWRWRLAPGALDEKLARKLKAATKTFDRIPAK